MRRRVLLGILGIAFLAAGVWPFSSCGPSAPPAGDDEDVVLGASEVHGARPRPPLLELARGESWPTLSFFAIGDTGYGGRILSSVAEAMERSARERPVVLALLLGDNFYPSGMRSLDDERWRTVFEEPFAAKELAIPFYAVLGNHDHRGNAGTQIAYTAKSERWRMPDRWYTFAREGEGGITAQFFALDTDPIEESRPDATVEVKWLEEELSKSSARWKIVFGHHPAVSHGKHGGTREIVERIVPLFERYGVDLYVSGHDHDLQLLRSGGNWLQLVSGSGSSTRDTEYGGDTLFASASPGYAWVGLGPKVMWIEIATATEGPRFRWRVEKP